ncbi:MAG TPA: HD domain-containing phosphohydrolase [Acidobacteriaceae bacterium]|nr:HD domain-containing phosphohydrolase [Acidobacteriaceae bacterium]
MPARILVVEDQLSQRELLAELLSLDGYAVICASDGIQAEALLFDPLPDLVLLDVNLPFRNGFDICRRLKERLETRLIPVVMVTGLTDSQDRLRGIEAGADDFLTKPFDRSELKARVRSLVQRKEYTDELDRADHVLMAMGKSIEAKDPYTVGHCARISAYSTLLGDALELSPEEIRALRIAGSVHDIGKIGVPDAILLKKGPLSDEEWVVMRQHTVVGERICRPLRSFQSVLPIIRSHHERQDGSGYPDGLRGDKVPLLARVMQIADVFDALATERPYKQAMSCQESLRQMQIEVDGGWWDSALFRIFAALARREGLPWSSASLETLI